MLKANKKYIMLHKVTLNVGSANDILRCNNSNNSRDKKKFFFVVLFVLFFFGILLFSVTNSGTQERQGQAKLI